eukprot:CAMPEP_0177700188 /NCGR_PEP_ID=MMETSP0484_2-20121128/5968_1 /TAXON_ID=354590 /ORGANISM="Rhodomonas lens, Strain RHODO" /LENGTH=88 /DNA_ID=CAMNT_0019211385 /DNA_START=8 /DNA_END=272 /DNA_ORIENTATION=+
MTRTLDFVALQAVELREETNPTRTALQEVLQLHQSAKTSRMQDFIPEVPEWVKSLPYQRYVIGGFELDFWTTFIVASIVVTLFALTVA